MKRRIIIMKVHLLFLLMIIAIIVSSNNNEVLGFTTPQHSSSSSKTSTLYARRRQQQQQTRRQQPQEQQGQGQQRRRRPTGEEAQPQQQSSNSPVTTNSNFANRMTESMNLFFSSTAIRKRRLDVHPNDAVTELSDDGYFQIFREKGKKTMIRATAISKSQSSIFGAQGCMFGFKKKKRRRRPLDENDDDNEEKVLFERIVVDDEDENEEDNNNNSDYHPLIVQTLRALEDATENINIAAFDENTSGIGGLRGVQCQLTSENQICLTLVWYAETLKETQPALTRLVKEVQRKTSPDLFHSIWCHCNDDLDDPNKNIRARFFCRDANRWSRLLGPEFIRQPLNLNNDEDNDDDDEENGPFMYQSPMSGNTVFHSNSLRMEKDIVWDCILSEDDDSTSRVCDLCAGTGLIGLTAASKYSKSIQWLRLCGENESDVRCFQRSLKSINKNNPNFFPDQRNNRRGNDNVDYIASIPVESNKLTMAEIKEIVEKNKKKIMAFNPDVQRQQRQPPKYKVESASDFVFEWGRALGANVAIVRPLALVDERLLLELCKPHNANQAYVEDAADIDDEDLDNTNWFNDVKTLVYMTSNPKFPAKDLEALLLSPNSGWMLQSAKGYTNNNNNNNSMDMVFVLKRS